MSKIGLIVIGLLSSLALQAQEISLMGFTLGQKLDLSHLSGCNMQEKVASKDWHKNLSQPCYIRKAYVELPKVNDYETCYVVIYYPALTRPQYLNKEDAGVILMEVNGMLASLYFTSDEPYEIAGAMISKFGDVPDRMSDVLLWYDDHYLASVIRARETVAVYVKDEQASMPITEHKKSLKKAGLSFKHIKVMLSKIRI